jgi:hypothetical protein
MCYPENRYGMQKSGTLAEKTPAVSVSYSVRRARRLKPKRWWHGCRATIERMRRGGSGGDSASTTLGGHIGPRLPRPGAIRHGRAGDRRCRTRFEPRTAGITSVVEERSTEARSQRGAETETPSQARMHRRLGARLPLGGLLGAMAGVAIGALVGFLFFDRPVAIIMSILASAIFGLGVGMLVAGYSSLESPDPGAEPSDTARPVADRPEAVRKEQDPPLPS